MIKQLTDENYVEYMDNTQKVVFIELMTPMCSACQMIYPTLENMDKHYDEQDVQIATIDVSRNPKLAKKFQISSVPVCISIDKNKNIIDYEMGAKDSERYFKMVDKAMGKTFWKSIKNIFSSK